MPAAPQSITTATIFASDCVTPNTTFNLGDTVCVQFTGAIGFRLQWVDADGFVVATSDIRNDPQSASFVLPSTIESTVGGIFTVNNLGRWRVNAVTSRNSVNKSVFFTVRDPGNPKVDLSIVKSLVGSTTPGPGEPVQFAIRVVNNGPDDAADVHLSDGPYSNAVFVGITQTSGSAFTCSGADCSIASLANGAEATFVISFTTSFAGGAVANSATISSSTTELNPKDNTSSTAPIEVDAGVPPPPCDIAITAPAAITLFTGPGATSCDVTVSDPDATLGTAAVTGTCVVDEGVTRVPSGNVLPVGNTIVTYTATDSLGHAASATQSVTVVDNTPPAIACPANITLEATCPAGAVASWPTPAGTDNCPGVTTVQSGGPGTGSVFPIGSTAVTYTVSDAAGNHASCTFTVTVVSADATIENLKISVNASSLTGPQKQGLLPKLDAAQSALNRGSMNAACNVLATFVDSVQKHISHGDVSAAQGQAWITSATHVSNAIGCTSDPCS